MLSAHISTASLTLFLALAVAVIWDLKWQRIPNWLTLPAMIMGLFFNTAPAGLQGLLAGASGLCLGLAVFFIPYLLGGMGGGDVKLMGAAGAFLGPKGVVLAFFYTALIGGIYAIILIIKGGHLREDLGRYAIALKTFFCPGMLACLPVPRGERPKLCYSVAIALGTIVAVLGCPV